MNIASSFIVFKYSYFPNRDEYDYFRDKDIPSYILSDNVCELNVLIQGDDAISFEEEIQKIDNLPPPQCYDKMLKDNLISSYL